MQHKLKIKSIDRHANVLEMNLSPWFCKNPSTSHLRKNCTRQLTNWQIKKKTNCKTRSIAQNTQNCLCFICLFRFVCFVSFKIETPHDCIPHSCNMTASKYWNVPITDCTHSNRTFHHFATTHTAEPRDLKYTNLQLTHASVSIRTFTNWLIDNHLIDDPIKQPSLPIIFFRKKKPIPTELTFLNFLRYLCFHLVKVSQSRDFHLKEAKLAVAVSMAPLHIRLTPKRYLSRTQIDPGGIDIWWDPLKRPQFFQLWWGYSDPQTNAVRHGFQAKTISLYSAKAKTNGSAASMQTCNATNASCGKQNTHCKSQYRLISWLWSLPHTVPLNQRPMTLQSSSNSAWQLHVPKCTVSPQQCKLSVHHTSNADPPGCRRNSFFFPFRISNWDSKTIPKTPWSMVCPIAILGPWPVKWT